MRNYILILALIFSGFTHAQIFDFGCPSSPLEGEQRMLRAAGFSDTVTSTLPEAVPGYVFQHTDGRWIEYTDSEDGTPWTTSRGGDFATAAEALAYLNSLGGALPPGGLQGFSINDIIQYIERNPPPAFSGKGEANSNRLGAGSCVDGRPLGDRIDLQTYTNIYGRQFLIIRSAHSVMGQRSQIPTPTLSLVRVPGTNDFTVERYDVDSQGSYAGQNIYDYPGSATPTRTFRGESLVAANAYDRDFTYIFRRNTAGGTLNDLENDVDDLHPYDIQLHCSDFTPTMRRPTGNQSGCTTDTLATTFLIEENGCDIVYGRWRVCNFDGTDTTFHYRREVSACEFVRDPAIFDSQGNILDSIEDDDIRRFTYSHPSFSGYEIQDLREDATLFVVDGPVTTFPGSYATIEAAAAALVRHYYE